MGHGQAPRKSAGRIRKPDKVRWLYFWAFCIFGAAAKRKFRRRPSVFGLLYRGCTAGTCTGSVAGVPTSGLVPRGFGVVAGFTEPAAVPWVVRVHAQRDQVFA